jgi:hypothetical protein
MKNIELQEILSHYPLDMEVLVYDSEVKKSMVLQIAIRTTKAGITLEPPALIIYPDHRLR